MNCHDTGIASLRQSLPDGELLRHGDHTHISGGVTGKELEPHHPGKQLALRRYSIANLRRVAGETTVYPMEHITTRFGL